MQGNHALVSRDKFSYNEYGDLTSYSFNGIDSAFFISNYFRPPELLVKEFYVLTFDSIPEPKFICDENKPIMRAHHSSVWMNDGYFNKPNTLISDLPTDYLTLYANAKLVISDRVHACVASLAYGNKAMLISSTPRLEMFKPLGLQSIKKEAVAVDPELLQNKKDSQVEFIKELFSI